MNELRAMLMRHEGFRRFPYKDTLGIETVAFGRNLRDVGISQDEAKILLDNDIMAIAKILREMFPWFSGLDPVRQDVLVDMAFMGPQKLLEFHHFIAALEQGDYARAAVEMVDSDWAHEVKDRATELSQMMRSGEYRFTAP